MTETLKNNYSEEMRKNTSCIFHLRNVFIIDTNDAHSNDSDNCIVDAGELLWELTILLWVVCYGRNILIFVSSEAHHVRAATIARSWPVCIRMTKRPGFRAGRGDHEVRTLTQSIPYEIPKCGLVCSIPPIINTNEREGDWFVDSMNNLLS